MGVWMPGGSIGFAIGPVMVAVLPGSVLGRDEGERGLKGLEAEVPVGGHAEASTAQHKQIAGPACQTHRGLRNSKGRGAVAEPCPIAAWDGCRVTDGGSGV